MQRSRAARVLTAAAAAACMTAPSVACESRPATPSGDVPEALPNDNRSPAGSLRRGVLRLRLEARLAAWRPDLGVDSLVTVQAFAEEGDAPRIPGPLLRAVSGTEVRLTIRNALPDSTLVVHGLRAGTVEYDTLHVAPGATRELAYDAGAPGTYLYWGTTTGSPVGERNLRDSQLTGAIVIDVPGEPRDPVERIFVMTVLDVYPSDTVRNRAGEDIWELAINGRAWPHTERLEYPVGDTVRWRWLNGSYLPHPMHLHGFHFRVLSKGSGSRDTTYAQGAVREAVTEFMPAGSTFRMEWVPVRAGTWLMHCHMIPHIVPFPERPDSARVHDVHDVASHPALAMAGLVLGITTVDRSAPLAHRRASAEADNPQLTTQREPVPGRRLRVFAQQASTTQGKPTPRGYVLQRDAEPRADSVETPGTPLVLTRGETTAITVINRLAEATTVHWHGLELESRYDGVAGWSRTGSSVAPLVAPGDSFTVVLTPPRAGTFIYHTHMDEGAQLGSGMYGALLVLESGQQYDPATDLAFIIGGAVEADSATLALNGHSAPPPLRLRTGARYRIRLINIHSADAASVQLAAGSQPLAWRPLAKDGADLPATARVPGPASLPRIGVGETFDFEWTPATPMEATLTVQLGGTARRQALRVRP